jgi:hypothetical protein
MAITLRAEGPVPAGSVPGGVTVTDDDSGSGEKWGRPGGRTMTFSVNVPGNFSAISWGAVSGQAPHVAFDGSVTPATSEVLAFNAGASNLPGGVAVWTGGAVVQLVTTGPELLPTRLTVTVTNGGGSVPLTFVGGEVSPGVNVLTAGAFTANILFEAQRFGVWHPVLDLYDGLPTPVGNPPGTTGPVMTGFSHGFYYTSSSSLSLIDHHDTTMTKLNSIKDDTAFLRIDAINRLISLGVDVSTVGTQVNGLGSNINNIGNQVSQLQSTLNALQFPQNLASQQDVSNAKNDIQTMMLILFGLAPCPSNAGPLCEQATFVSHLAKRQVDVQVLEVSNPSTAQSRRWLVRTSLHGAPVDADLTKLVAITTSTLDPAIVQDITTAATVLSIATGLKDVTIPVTPGSTNPHAYQFEVGIVGPPPLAGSAMVTGQVISGSGK